MFAIIIMYIIQFKPYDTLCVGNALNTSIFFSRLFLIVGMFYLTLNVSVFRYV